MKGVILAGGTGSRLHPLTRITNKHLLPIYDRPMINWGIEALVNAEITEIMLVTGGTHAGEFLRLLGQRPRVRHRPSQLRLPGAARRDRRGPRAGRPVRRRRAGAGDAGRQHRRALDQADGRRVPGRSRTAPGSCSPRSRRTSTSAISACPTFDGDERIVGIVEKPEQPASKFGVTGIYCYDADVFEVIPTLVPSGRGELEITDVNNHYIGQGTMAYDVLEGFWGDAGESIDAYYTVNDFVRTHGANKG